MSTKTINNIFDQLYHKDFNSKQKAIETLMGIRSASFLEMILKRVQENSEDESNIFVLTLCENILKEDNLEASYWALIILSKLRASDSHFIAIKALSICDFYFRNQNIITSYKAYTIQRIWNKSSTEDKKYFIEKISEYKIHSLINLVISTFSNTEDTLLIESIQAIKSLKDTRGNSELRKLLKHKNTKVQSLAIETLGETGGVFDYVLIRKFLYTSNFELIKTAITATRKLLGNNSVFVFSKLYSSLIYDTKKFLINEFSKINSPKSLKFLINLMEKEKHRKLITNIEWAIYNISTKKKIKTIINNYNLKSKNTQYRLLNILSDFHDSRCKDHFIRVYNSSEEQYLKLVCINLLRPYTDKLTMMFIEGIYSKNKDENLKLACVRTLLNQPRVYSKKFFATLVKSEKIDENTILLMIKYIQNTKSNYTIDSTQDFIKNCLSSDNKNIVLSSLMAIEVHHNEKLFKELLSHFNDTKMKFASKHIEMTIINMLTKFPYYLTSNNIESLPSPILNNFNIYEIPYQLLIHLIRLSLLSPHESLNLFIQNNNKKICARIHQILNEFSMSSEESIFLINFLIDQSYSFNQRSFDLITQEFFSELNTKQKNKFLTIILRNKNIYSFDFIHTEYRYIMKNQDLKNSYFDYVGDYL